MKKIMEAIPPKVPKAWITGTYLTSVIFILENSALVSLPEGRKNIP
jgi:hypothetical protein